MKLIEYALVRFMEEANEVGQEASKVLVFTPDHKPEEYPTTNLERLREEFAQLLGMACVLEDLGLDMGLGTHMQVPFSTYAKIKRKQEKFYKYLEISRKLGVQIDAPSN
jgi:hypothetical protein